jgi:hypothetical protein
MKAGLYTWIAEEEGIVARGWAERSRGPHRGDWHGRDCESSTAECS